MTQMRNCISRSLEIKKETKPRSARRDMSKDRAARTQRPGVVARPRRAAQSSENFEASHPQFVAFTTEYSALLSALGI